MYNIIENYIERVFLFAKHHTYNLDEAEELSQEIYLQLCKCIGTVKSETSIEAWIWSVSRNTLCAFRRKRGKDRDNVIWYGESDLLNNIEHEEYNDDNYNNLRTKLIGLSSEYRNILVMYYFDKLSVKEIAVKTGIAEGTIKWRLSEGREKIKREWDNMTDTLIKPKKISVSITSGSGKYGNGILYPGEYFNDALAQNILWHTRRESKSVEELSILTGVPAFYIEDRINDMGYREALIKTGNKYKTDFIIYDKELVDDLNTKGYEVAEKIYEPVINAIKSIGVDIWRNGVIVTSNLDEELNCTIRDRKYYDNKYSRIRYDGYNWLYHGYEDNVLFSGIWWTSQGGINTKYNSIAYKFKSNIIYKVRDNLTIDEIDEFYKIKNDYANADKNIVIKMNEKGYIKDDKITVPYYTLEEYKEIVAKGRIALADIKNDFKDCMKQRNDYYLSLLGKEYNKNVFDFHSRDLFCICAELAVEHGLIEPSADEYCDWIIER